MREVSAPVTPPPSEPEQPASENRAEFAERTHERPHLRDLLRRAVTIIEAEAEGYDDFLTEARAAAFGTSPSGDSP